MFVFVSSDSEWRDFCFFWRVCWTEDIWSRHVELRETGIRGLNTERTGAGCRQFDHVCWFSIEPLMLPNIMFTSNIVNDRLYQDFLHVYVCLRVLLTWSSQSRSSDVSFRVTFCRTTLFLSVVCSLFVLILHICMSLNSSTVDLLISWRGCWLAPEVLLGYRQSCVNSSITCQLLNESGVLIVDSSVWKSQNSLILAA